MNVIKPDVILWRILAIAGLNFVDYKLGFIEKCMRIFFMVGFPLSLTYFVAISWFLLQNNRRYKEAITYLLSPIYSGLLWYFAYSRKRAISNLVMEAYHYRKLYCVSIKPFRHIIIFLIFVLFVLHWFICILELIFRDFQTISMGFWTFGYEIRNKNWKILLKLCLDFADIAFISDFPYYITICACILFFRCSEILLEYKKLLRIHLRTKNVKRIEDLLAMFFWITKFLRKLSNTFSHIAFTIIVYNLKTIFAQILTISNGFMYTTNIWYMIITLYNVTRTVVTIVSFTVCSSMIPERLLEIRTFIRDILNGFDYNKLISKRSLHFLRRIENQDIVYISACGVLSVNRNFILSAIGLMLTYGIVILDLKI